MSGLSIVEGLSYKYSQDVKVDVITHMFDGTRNLMPGPCSVKNLISILVTDYIQKRRGQALLFSFEYDLLPKLISNFNHYLDRT